MSDALEVRDIQGNILSGFNTNIEVLVGLTADPTRTRDTAEWLIQLAPQVTTVFDVRELRRVMKPLEKGGDERPITWLCVAIGSDHFFRIRQDAFPNDRAFRLGFRKRAPTALGDETTQDDWVVGGPKNPLDVFLIVASNVEAAAEQRAGDLILSAEASGLKCTYRETARRIADLEHFGFRDGVSQPRIRDFDSDGDVGAGHFVFGYAKAPGGSPFNPGGDPSNFLRNGSFLVFRRLEQDVAKFREFCDAKVRELATEWPGLTGAHLEALLVGRWPSGALASVDVIEDPGPPPSDNGFDFSNDMLGKSCPFGAHIRKVNPRKGPRDEVEVPRILRRGIPFGPPFEQDKTATRGLAFVSFQTSIADQLEFLTGRWMNSPSRPGPDAGHDLLVGRSRPTRSMTITGPVKSVQVSDGGIQWITPTGGGYLFAPARSALTRLLDPVPEGVAWRLERTLSFAIDNVVHALSLNDK